jgi:antitoxin component YwqK of YwqJK toxin-antitoxin module
MTVANYEDGELEGRYVEYDEEGVVLTQGLYSSGYEEGVWTYRNGSAIETGRYEGGLREGTWKTWFESGKIASEIQYSENLMDGKYTLYWENGNVRFTGKYENGLQEGIWQLYNEEGILSITTLFKEGKELKWNNYTIK